MKHKTSQATTSLNKNLRKEKQFKGFLIAGFIPKSTLVFYSLGRQSMGITKIPVINKNQMAFHKNKKHSPMYQYTMKGLCVQ